MALPAEYYNHDVIVGQHDSYDPSSWSVSHKLQDEYHDVMITSSFLITSGLGLTGSELIGFSERRIFYWLTSHKKFVDIYNRFF